jgi:hypothetical protein
MDTSKRGTVKLTRDIDRFMCRLRDGDVLLFDTLHPVSHMIKLADNSPVSHAAIYQESGQCIIHASAPHGDRLGPAIREEPLRPRLKERQNRTVTAFRHSDPAIAAKALQHAQHKLTQTSRYGFTDLLGLAASCLNRSYRQTKYKSLRLGLTSMSVLMRRVSTFAAADQPMMSMTCSEFVYSCYVDADPSSLVIRDPLSVRRLKVLWTELRFESRPKRKYFGQGADPAASSWGIPKRAEDDFEWVEDVEIVRIEAPQLLFHDQSDALVPPPEAPIDDLGVDASLTNEHYGLYRQFLHNRRLGKLVPTAKGDEVPWAEHITPFDLWQSESLQVFQILHFPPLDDDPVWKRTGGSARGRVRRTRRSKTFFSGR